MRVEEFVLGIDACKFGWMTAKLTVTSKLQLSLHNNFSELISLYNNPSKIFIDIPIGLPETTFRHCDLEARKLLGRKASSIFPVPARDAVYSNDYEAACKINFNKMGKMFSKQSWNILPKVREIDRYLLCNRNLISKIYESHPELCFFYLNNSAPVFEKKKSKEGQAIRLKIITSLIGNKINIIQEFLANTKRKDVAFDDVSDSIILAIAALRSNKKRRVPLDRHYDCKKLPMNIYH